MTGREIRDMSASVYQRLLNMARGSGEDFQLKLTSYALERLLYRLCKSPHTDRFVLKGATLFCIWTDHPHRPTRDVDLLGWGDCTVPELEQVFREICGVEAEDDGLVFHADTVRGEEIREELEYGGVRIHLNASLGNARIPLKVDVGFGDAVFPKPDSVRLPSLLGLPAPNMRVYTRESVIAEKLHAMIVRGMLNSRMKDFYDLWVLAREFAYDGTALAGAIAATFARRQTVLSSGVPTAFSEEFYTDATKQAQWEAFLRRGRLAAGSPSLQEVTHLLRDFLMPPIHAASEGRGWPAVWRPHGPWLPSDS